MDATLSRRGVRTPEGVCVSKSLVLGHHEQDVPAYALGALLGEKPAPGLLDAVDSDCHEPGLDAVRLVA